MKIAEKNETLADVITHGKVDFLRSKDIGKNEKENRCNLTRMSMNHLERLAEAEPVLQKAAHIFSDLSCVIPCSLRPLHHRCSVNVVEPLRPQLFYRLSF